MGTFVCSELGPGYDGLLGGVMYCEWCGVCDFIVLLIVEVCADCGGVNVFHVCLIYLGVVFGVCVNVCGVVCCCMLFVYYAWVLWCSGCVGCCDLCLICDACSWRCTNNNNHMVETYSSMGLVMALYDAMIVSFCFPHVLDVSALSICIVCVLLLL